MKLNLRTHEHIGLFLMFLGATWLGLGVYATLLAANRLLLPETPLIAGAELLVFPIFYGFGALLIALGQIELREAKPGKGRR